MEKVRAFYAAKVGTCVRRNNGVSKRRWVVLIVQACQRSFGVRRGGPSRSTDVVIELCRFALEMEIISLECCTFHNGTMTMSMEASKTQ